MYRKHEEGVETVSVPQL